MKIRTLLLNLSILLTLNACIDPYDVSENKRGKILVVEGLLTNDVKNPDTIRIQYSSDYGGYITTEPVASVRASLVLSSTGKEIKLNEFNKGTFLPPTDFRLNISEKYTLKFTLNNQQYESSPQQMTLTPPIAKIYDRFNEKSRLSADGKTFSAANEIFLDFQDIPNQKNYYLWRYYHYERLSYCVTCEPNTLYFRGLGCKSYNYQSVPSYDYLCEGPGRCYKIFKGKNVNILADGVSEGRFITGRPIAKIPFYAYSGCLVEVQQMCVSPDIFAYNKILESQLQGTGGLTDTPPVAIVGNIKNITDSKEQIVGFFGVVDIQKKRYWVSRENASGYTEYILGHQPVNEPPSVTRPPYAPCSLATDRTPVTPEGWQ